MNSEFDAASLSDKISHLASKNRNPIEINIKSVSEGKYPTQRGEFIIATETTITSICVWSKGRVEIMTLDSNGKQKEIETICEMTLENAAAKVIKHVARHT